MGRHSRILLTAFTCVWQRKQLWPIAFLQLISLSLAVRTLRTFGLGPNPQIFWGLSLLVIFSFATVSLWLTVQAYAQKQPLAIKFFQFFISVAKVLGFAVLGIVLDLSLRSLHLHWTAFVFLASLINAGLVAMMLSAVLFGFNFKRSLALSLDFWNHKISFISASVFVVLIGHGLSYYLAHAFWPKTRQSGGFEAFSPSATIWIGLVVLAVVAAFFASLLNAFLVMLFLDTTNPKKPPEAVKSGVVHAAAGI